MIESVITTPVTLTSNSSAVTFQDDYRSRSANCCGWLSHTNRNPLYKIIKGGSYDVGFSATVTSATDGIVALGLYQDGILIPASISAATVTAGDLTNLKFDKKFRVCCNANTTITIGAVPTVNAGVTGTTATTTQVPIITNAIVSIERKG